MTKPWERPFRRFDEKLKSIVVSFAALLGPIIDTVNQHGLKGVFLKKFRASVDKFFLRLARMTLTTEAALKCPQRFEKNKDQLFTFLESERGICLVAELLSRPTVEQETGCHPCSTLPLSDRDASCHAARN
jgi:hypothetical protein